MNGALLWIAGLIVALLAALFAVPYAVDWNVPQGLREASRMLDREVRIGGVSASACCPSRMSGSKPRIADADTARPCSGLIVHYVVDLPSLVQGILEAKQVELERPILRLQVEEDGEGTAQLPRTRSGIAVRAAGVALQSVHINEAFWPSMRPAPDQDRDRKRRTVGA